jgi:hypothetical protein
LQGGRLNVDRFSLSLTAIDYTGNGAVQPVIGEVLIEKIVAGKPEKN